jgi:hypothetical protein
MWRPHRESDLTFVEAEAYDTLQTLVVYPLETDALNDCAGECQEQFNEPIVRGE